MLVNLTDIFTLGHEDITLEAILDSDNVTIGPDTYSVIEKKPVFLTLKNMGNGKVMVHAITSQEVMLSCDRCLKNVKYCFNLDFETQVISPEIAGEEDERDFMEGYHLNVDNMIFSEMILNWPMKILCREGCKGICKSCGKDLNTGTCECDTFVPSPGLAGIKEIFNAYKEV